MRFKKSKLIAVPPKILEEGIELIKEVIKEIE